MRGITIPEAAYLLEVPEYYVKRLVRDCRIEVLSKGAGMRPRMLSREDVYYVHRQMQIQKTMSLVATIGTSDNVDTALHVSGLKVAPAADVLDAVSAHPPGVVPVIIIGPGCDLGEQVRVFKDKARFVMYDGESLRDITKRAWDAVIEARASK